MAAASIDRAMVMKLICAQISGVTGLSVVYTREGEPEADKWVKLRPLGMIRRDRVREGTGGGGDSEPEFADIEFRCVVMVGERLANQYALETAVQKVSDALKGKTLQDSGTTHDVELYQVTEGAEMYEDEERRIVGCGLTVRGEARRQSGVTVLDFLS